MYIVCISINVKKRIKYIMLALEEKWDQNRGGGELEVDKKGYGGEGRRMVLPC